MKVAAVQSKAIKGDKKASLKRLTALAEQAAAGADLVVLPEMAATGYVFSGRDEIAPHAEPADGETYEVFASIARRHGTWMVSGFAERDGDRFFNSAHVIDPEGKLHGCYRKTLLYDTDKSWAEPGDSGYLRVETAAGAFTVGICMDLNDDRFTAWCRTAQVTAIAFPTNWLDQGENIWPYWAWRLAGVRSALVAANTYGEEADLRFIGGSAILSGNRLLAAGPREGDAVLTATLGQKKT